MVIIDFGGPIEEKVSGLEGYHVAFEVRLRCDERLGIGDVRDMVIVDFGNPIEEKVSGLEGCHGAFEVIVCRL